MDRRVNTRESEGRDWIVVLVTLYIPGLTPLRAWLKYLDDNETIWHFSRAQGPLKSQYDISNCGVYTTIVLGMWSVGKEVRSSEIPELIPNMYRKEMLGIILRAEEEERIQIN